MTKKDYIMIAEALVDGYKNEYKNNDEEVGYSLFKEIVVSIAGRLKSDNHKFNHALFLDYIEERI